ncbi:hypothetical protein VTO42DRAFT_6246 [Malbranchea cinnamomea]
MRNVKRNPSTCLSRKANLMEKVSSVDNSAKILPKLLWSLANYSTIDTGPSRPISPVCLAQQTVSRYSWNCICKLGIYK